MAAASTREVIIEGERFPSVGRKPKFESGHKDPEFIALFENPVVEAYVRACARLQQSIEGAVEAEAFVWRFSACGKAIEASLGRITGANDDYADESRKRQKTMIFRLSEVQSLSAPPMEFFAAEISVQLIELNAEDAAFMFGRGNRQNLSLKLVARIINAGTISGAGDRDAKASSVIAVEPLMRKNERSPNEVNVIQLFEGQDREPKLVRSTPLNGRDSKTVKLTAILGEALRQPRNRTTKPDPKDLNSLVLFILLRASLEALDKETGNLVEYPSTDNDNEQTVEPNLTKGPAEDQTPHPGAKGAPEEGKSQKTIIPAFEGALDRQSFAEWFVQMRTANGFVQTDIIQMTGVEKSLLARIETGKAPLEKGLELLNKMNICSTVQFFNCDEGPQ